MRIIGICLCISLLAASAAAEEKPVQLKSGPGLEKVEANCSACHSLDYIEMNSPFLNASGWDAEITKMIKVFGAPIQGADVKDIAEYLKANYGS
jgi:sulfite dehydrogenase (cytochrome) subunit B